jgi:hypothetical protein
MSAWRERLAPQAVRERPGVDERFTLVAHLPGGLRGWQDVVVLRRR